MSRNSPLAIAWRAVKILKVHWIEGRQTRRPCRRAAGAEQPTRSPRAAPVRPTAWQTRRLRKPCRVHGQFYDLWSLVSVEIGLVPDACCRFHRAPSLPTTGRSRRMPLPTWVAPWGRPEGSNGSSTPTRLRLGADRASRSERHLGEIAPFGRAVLGCRVSASGRMSIDGKGDGELSSGPAGAVSHVAIVGFGEHLHDPQSQSDRPVVPVGGAEALEQVRLVA